MFSRLFFDIFKQPALFIKAQTDVIVNDYIGLLFISTLLP